MDVNVYFYICVQVYVNTYLCAYVYSYLNFPAQSNDKAREKRHSGN